MSDSLDTVTGADPVTIRAAVTIRKNWDDVGLTGEFLARNLSTGEQLGFGTGVLLPLASVAKVPLALVVLHAIAIGTLDAAHPVRVDPATSSFGATGLSAFRYPAQVAVQDLVYLMLAVSDNAAADALLDLIGLEEINHRLADWEVHDLRFRHRFQTMYDCAVGVAGDDFRLALDLAIEDDAQDRHRIESLDVAKANVGSAPALVSLLERVWTDRIGNPWATRELRTLMGRQIYTHRLASELQTDDFAVAAKTGTFLNLRHEIGVVRTNSGDQIAIAALTRSRQRALVQQQADLAIGAAARTAVALLAS